MSGFMAGGGPRGRGQGYMQSQGYAQSVPGYAQRSDSDSELYAGRFPTAEQYDGAAAAGSGGGGGSGAAPVMPGSVGYIDSSRAAAAHAAAAASMQSYYPVANSAYGMNVMAYAYPTAGYMPYGSGAAAGAAGGGAGGPAAYYGSYPGTVAVGGRGVPAAGAGPGVPIQTTRELHGPDGCNLFVFHIPNDMTNMDLYTLFAQFGNVISARIMVDRATGRSRGFGFVSYDFRNAAETAIRGMNGYQIGHKRLKVQHKKERDRPVPIQDAVTSPGGAGARNVPAGRYMQEQGGAPDTEGHMGQTQPRGPAEGMPAAQQESAETAPSAKTGDEGAPSGEDNTTAPVSSIKFDGSGHASPGAGGTAAAAAAIVAAAPGWGEPRASSTKGMSTSGGISGTPGPWSDAAGVARAASPPVASMPMPPASSAGGWDAAAATAALEAGVTQLAISDK